MKDKKSQRQEQFLEIADRYKEVIAKVCSVYASPSMPFSDLYQEVMVNLWTGLDTFRGDSRMSTWIYRIALNTCLSCYRHAGKFSRNMVNLDTGIDIPDTDTGYSEEIRELYAMIGRLDPIDRALITLWLDEKSYEEISAIMGIGKSNVATRLFRIKQKLTKMAAQ